MSERAWVRSHVERLLQDEWDECRVWPDGDGDYGFRRGTAACWVTLLDTEPVMIRVWAHAAHSLRPSARLFRELNDINSRALSAKVTLVGDAVLVSQTISPYELTRPVLAQALSSVSGVANDIGLLLAGMFGGQPPYPAEVESDEEVA